MWTFLSEIALQHTRLTNLHKFFYVAFLFYNSCKNDLFFLQNKIIHF